MFRFTFFVSVIALTLPSWSAFAEDGDSSRRIEEVVVTAEKVEATVSDTSISITAFGSDMLEDMGIQDANEFVNYIPATTRDTYDIRIRGVGRNFRSLGGDPGVGTFYNGIYSEDALIALTENGLFDIERIEVLRGPQGTLYGRNSIGGAINYITKRPTDSLSGMVRVQAGADDNREYYGVISGPISDEIRYRLTSSWRENGDRLSGVNGNPSSDSTYDKNTALSLEWDITDSLNWSIRVNDRNSDRSIGHTVLMNEGWGDWRGTNGADRYTQGIRLVDETTPGAQMFTHPDTGAIAWGASPRAGVDVAARRVNPSFGTAGYLNGDGDPENAAHELLTNGYNREGFDQSAASSILTLDYNDSLKFKYLFGYSDFAYTYSYDTDDSASDIVDYGQTVLEDIYSLSHELQMQWDVNENLFVTAGLYYFYSSRLQDFAFTDDASQGRIDQPANYGNLAPFLVGLGVDLTGCEFGSSEVGQQQICGWIGPHSVAGDRIDDNAYYRHHATNKTEQTAIYGQATYQINDQFALTLGLRHAKDEKDVSEIRAAYFEDFFPFDFDTLFLGGALRSPLAIGVPSVGLGPEAFAGFTDLALANFWMGAGVPTGIAASPLFPTCALDATTCATPLRLSGIPFDLHQRTTDTQEWSDTNFRINLDWEPNEDTLIYAYVTTGYRSGGYGLGILDARFVLPDNPNGDTSDFYKPLSYDEETVVATEIGYKGTLFDGTVQVFSAIYQYDYEGYQDEVQVFDDVQQAFAEIPTNTGDAKNQGFEIEATWLATDALTLNANYSYSKTEYQSDVFLAVDQNPLAPSPLFGEVATDPATGLAATSNGVQTRLAEFYNLNGEPLKGIPEQKFTGWGTYIMDLPNNSTLALQAAYSFTGEYSSNSIDRDFYMIPDRQRVDLSVKWTSADMKTSVRAFIDNATDEKNFYYIGQGSHTTNYRYQGTLLQERTWGLDFQRLFGDY